MHTNRFFDEQVSHEHSLMMTSLFSNTIHNDMLSHCSLVFVNKCCTFYITSSFLMLFIFGSNKIPPTEYRAMKTNTQLLMFAAERKIFI